MARGWESKSVESQQQDKDTPKSRVGTLTPAQRDRKDRRTSLELSRRRIANDIANSRSEPHKRTMQGALEHLDAEIKKIDEEG